MRRPIRSEQRDLFAAPATAPLSLPVATRTELICLLGALLSEVIVHQRLPARRTRREHRHG
jgi:hypothetical protein